MGFTGGVMFIGVTSLVFRFLWRRTGLVFGEVVDDSNESDARLAKSGCDLNVDIEDGELTDVENAEDVLNVDTESGIDANVVDNAVVDATEVVAGVDTNKVVDWVDIDEVEAWVDTVEVVAWVDTDEVVAWVDTDEVEAWFDSNETESEVVTNADNEVDGTEVCANANEGKAWVDDDENLNGDKIGGGVENVGDTAIEVMIFAISVELVWSIFCRFSFNFATFFSNKVRSGVSSSETS